MVIGAGCFVFMWQQQIVCWVFLLGAFMFALIQSLADILFVVSGILMVDTAWGFFKPLFGNYLDYLTYVYNKWVVLLLIAAVLEVYTMHRLDHELSKKNIKE